MNEKFFRGKSLTTNKWVYGGIVYECDKAFIVNIVDSKVNITEVIPETVCQHLGLYDTGGNKIFEEDILDIIDRTGYGEKRCTVIVRFGNNGRWGYEFVKLYGDDVVCAKDILCCTKEASELEAAFVMGNRFDNPELVPVFRNE